MAEAVWSLLAATSGAGSACGRAWSTGGEQAVDRLLSAAAWRALRGEYRRLRTRRERYPNRLPDLAHHDDPHALLEAGAAVHRIEELMPLAARRFGPRRVEALCDALRDRLHSGDADTEVALRHDVNRTQLCRARGWVEAALAG